MLIYLIGDVTSEGARAALSLSGTMLGFYPLKVIPSKTAIAPVDPKFLPKVKDAALILFIDSKCLRFIFSADGLLFHIVKPISFFILIMHYLVLH